MDLSEPDFGLALLNDCKYGHSCLGGKMAITLLKSSNDPDPDCNRGQNSFTYSLLPHTGGAENPEILKEAYALNEPLFAVPVKKQGGSLPAEYSFITSSTPSVIAETVKAAENGKGAVIRLLETKGTHTEATLTFGTAPKSVTLTNILEDDQEKITTDKEGKIKLTFHPFEIKTIRLTF
jgi:alpha-mannosidase